MWQPWPLLLFVIFPGVAAKVLLFPDYLQRDFWLLQVKKRTLSEKHTEDFTTAILTMMNSWEEYGQEFANQKTKVTAMLLQLQSNPAVDS